MKQPKLRFNADDGTKFPDWKEKKIGDITLSHNAGVYIAKDNYGTGTNIIGVGDIYESDVINGKQYRLAPVDSDEYILDEGDLVYGESSLVPEGIARTVCISAAGKGTAFAWHTRRYKVDRTIINPYFLTLQVNYAKRVRNHLMRVCTRNALTGMTTNEYFGTKVSVPCLPEQQKIASLFAEIDTLIQSAEKELDGYRELKQGMLQKMFPKKGEKVPEIRFPEFTGDWEQHKLGEVAPLRGGYAFKSDKYKTEGTPIVRISNILSDGSVGAEFAYYDDIEDDEKCTLGNGDALLAMSGATTGKVSILKCNNNDKYYQNQRVGYFERNEQYNYGFVSTIVRSDLFKEQLTLVLVAGAQPNVSSKEIDAFEFMFPNSIVEQKKIGEYFSNLDNLIALQQQELDGYKELKKGLLQQMFC